MTQQLHWMLLFFYFDIHDAERLAADPTVIQITRKEMYLVDDVFRRDLTAKSTNWRVMDWWNINEGNFPNIAKMALKYLAVPALSAAPSERVFPN